MQSQITVPSITGRGQVIPNAARKRCIGCFNISQSNFPISFDRDTGIGYMDPEGQWDGLDGGESLHSVCLHFCPVCGRSLKELAHDPTYPPPWEEGSKS